MFAHPIDRKLKKDHDASSKEALRRLRRCSLFVLSCVRMQQTTQEAATEHGTQGFRHQILSNQEGIRQAETTQGAPLMTLPSDLSAVLSILSEDNFRAVEESLVRGYCELREWFYEAPAFRHWETGRPWYLHCYGEPRCGKSTFAAAVAQRLRKKYRGDNQCLVLSLFLGHVNHKARYAASHIMLAGILQQMIESKLDKQCPLAAHEMLSFPSPETVQHCILKEMANLSKVFLVVDGLNDIPPHDSAQALEYLMGLLRLSLRTPCGLHLMLVQVPGSIERRKQIVCDVGREREPLCDDECTEIHWKCEDCEFFACQACYEQHHHCSNSRHILTEPYERTDVELHCVLKKYIDRKLRDHCLRTQIGRLINGAKGIVPHVRDEITSKARGIFLIVKLCLDFITEQQSLADILDVLDRLPSYQRLYFDSLIHEIKTQVNEDITFALTAMTLVTAYGNGSRPLLAMNFDELRAATMFKTKAQNTTFTKARFLNCTKGMLTIVNELPEVVVTFHESANIYLSEECQDLAEYSVDLTTVCLQAIMGSPMNRIAIKTNEPRVLLQQLEETPLMGYAYRTWAIHAQRAASRDAMDTVWKFLNQDYKRETYGRQMMFLACNNPGDKELWTGGGPLHVAAWFGLDSILGQYQEMQSREHIFDVDAQEAIKQRTALHLACIRKNSHMILPLLQMGASLTMQDCEGRTALWEAVDRTDVDAVEALFKGPHKAGEMQKAVNARNPWIGNQTILMLAVQKPKSAEREKLLDALLQRSDLDLNLQDDTGRTALHIAASMGNYASLLQLTASSKHSYLESIDLDMRDVFGRTSAIVALSSRYIEDDEVDQFVEFLRRIGNRDDFHVDAVDVNGRSLLHHAVTDERFQPIAKYLLEAGADVNKPDVYQRTPLHCAAVFRDELGDDGIMRLLIEARADLKAKDREGMRPYDLASEMKAPWKTELLSEGQVTHQNLPLIRWDDVLNDARAFFSKVKELSDEMVNQTSPVGFHLLHWAILERDPELAELVLQDARIHANVNARDHRFQTALHLAIENTRYGKEWSLKDLKVVELLLDHEADVNMVDGSGKTPLNYAIGLLPDVRRADHNFDLPIALIKKGARLILSEGLKQELLNFAIRNQDMQAVDILLRGGASRILYRRPALLPSETAEVYKASKEMVDLLQFHENDTLERVAKAVV